MQNLSAEALVAMPLTLSLKRDIQRQSENTSCGATKNTVVFLTLPAPLYVEPPSLCLFFSFCSIELSLKEDKVEMVLLVVVLWRMS